MGLLCVLPTGRYRSNTSVAVDALLRASLVTSAGWAVGSFQRLLLVTGGCQATNSAQAHEKLHFVL
jgi:hypothetical protein